MAFRRASARTCCSVLLRHRILHSLGPDDPPDRRPRKGPAFWSVGCTARREVAHLERMTELPGAILRVGRRLRRPYSLGGEAAPAPARALDVRVVELEARAVQPLDVVDFGAVEVLEAERVDVE